MLKTKRKKKKAENMLRESEERVRMKLGSLLSPEGGIENLELSDIIDSKSIQLLIDDFYKINHFSIYILDLKGNVLASVGWQDICSKFHRVNPETCKYCVESDLELSLGAIEGEFKLYKCKNGMWDAATPFIVGGKKLGNIYTGQFFFDDEPIDYEFFKKQAHVYGFNEKEYLAALDAVPRISRKFLDEGMSFFMKLFNMIAKLSYGNIKLARLIIERDNLTQSLGESKAFIESTLSAIDDVFYAFDLNGKFLSWNKAFSKVTGYSDEELSSKKPADFFSGEDARRISGAVEKIFKEGRAKQEANFVLKDGRQIPYEFTGSILKDGSGNIIGFSGTGRDLTDRKMAEAELQKYHNRLEELVKERTDELITAQQRYKELFENVNIGVCLTTPGPEGAFIDVNTAMAKTLEADNREQLMALHPSKIYLDESQRKIVSDDIMSKGFIDKEIWYKTLKGRPILCHITAAKKIDTKEQVYFYNTFEDITERKKTENELSEKYNELARSQTAMLYMVEDLNKQAKEIRETRNKLIRTEKLAVIGQLASSVAHEIRNPLGVIKNVVYYFNMLGLGKESTDIKENLDILVRETENINNIISDLLEFARIKKAISRLEDINVIVNEALRAIKVPGGIEVVAKLDNNLPKVEADALQMRQVFYNLAANAIQAMDKGETLTVSTRVQRTENSMNL